MPACVCTSLKNYQHPHIKEESAASKRRCGELIDRNSPLFPQLIVFPPEEPLRGALPDGGGPARQRRVRAAREGVEPARDVHEAAPQDRHQRRKREDVHRGKGEEVEGATKFGLIV